MLLTILYIIGITVESITGALAAGKRQMDLFGVIIIASVTSIGGGSVRDILLGQYPLSWVKNPEYIIIIAVTAVITVYIAPIINHLRKIFLILDALGLVVFSVIGAQTALDAGHSAIIASIASVITGVFGSVLRDMFCNRIPLVFQQELYAGIAFASGWLYILLGIISISHESATIITLLCGFLTRLLALRFRLSLPIFDYSDDEC